MKKVILLLIVFLGIYLLMGNSLIPDTPDTKPLAGEPKIELSTINVPISIPLSTIEKSVNEALPQEVYWATGEKIKDCPVDKCLWQLRVLRNGPITVHAGPSGELQVNIPLKTQDGRIDAMKRIFGKKIKTHATIDAEVIIITKLTLAMQEDWSAKPIVSLDVNVPHARARIFGLSISIPTLLQQAFEKNKNKLEEKIQVALEGKINIEDKAKLAWINMNNVQKINKDPVSWLVIHPVSIQVQNPKAHKKKLDFAIGIDAYIEVKQQNTPPKVSSHTSLPLLKVVDNIHQKYNIKVPVRVSVNEINALLKDLYGKEYDIKFENEDITIKLINSQIYTNGNELVVYIEVEEKNNLLDIFSLKLGVYIIGTPQYHAKNRTIYMDPFEYDAKTHNLLFEKAEWLFHGEIKDYLQKILTLNIAKDLDDAKARIEKALAHIDFGEHITLHGTVDKLSPVGIYISQEYINADVTATGTMYGKVKYNAIVTRNPAKVVKILTE